MPPAKSGKAAAAKAEKNVTPKMPLTRDQRIEIILMAGSGSTGHVAQVFNEKHGPEKTVTRDTVAKLIAKFKKTGNVDDQPRSGRPRSATDVDTSTAVLTALSTSPMKSIRRLSNQSGISKSSIHRILIGNKWPSNQMEPLDLANLAVPRNANGTKADTSSNSK